MWWTKAAPDGSGRLDLVNSYSLSEGGFSSKAYLLFPPVDQVYSDLRGRRFQHPAMHKPPWNFVTYGKLVLQHFSYS